MTKEPAIQREEGTGSARALGRNEYSIYMKWEVKRGG